MIVHSEPVNFGSGQVRSLFATAGVAALRRGLRKGENADLDQKMLFLNGKSEEVAYSCEHTVRRAQRQIRAGNDDPAVLGPIGAIKQIGAEEQRKNQ